MRAGASNNMEEVFDALDDLLPDEPQKAELRNGMEYAAPLHAKTGYYVFNDRHFKKTVRKNLRQLANSSLPMNRKNTKLALEKACQEEINFLRSKTEELRPPAPRNAAGRYIPVADRGDKRQAHPGGWADISGNLANGYTFEVDA